MPNTKTGTTWAPDIRPEKIETFEETYTPEGGEQQIIEYRAVNHHPILNKVLDKMAFFRTHVGAIWYNLAERKTLLTKLNELDAEIREVNAKIETEKPHIEAGNVRCTFSSSVRTYSVKFKKPFKNPSVAFAVNSGALSANVRATIKSVGNDGFEFYTYSDVSANSSGTIFWVATERTDVE